LAALEDPPSAALLEASDALLVSVARHHRLTPLLSITCGGRLPVTFAELCRRDRVVTAARNLVLTRTAQECVTALDRAGVPAIVLKGLDYETRLYGQTGARPTGDVDLLVPNAKRRVAFKVLDVLGFEPRVSSPGFDEPDYHEVAWTRAGIEVDLHMALAPLVRFQIDYSAIWSEARTQRLGDADALVLSPVHAAIFQAIHMGVDHFDVPAIYLIDLTRLLDSLSTVRAAETVARNWLCYGPYSTAVRLAATFLPRWKCPPAMTQSPPRRARMVIDSYGVVEPLPRVQQLVRKLLHFDTVDGALRYLAVQSRRGLREQFERRLRHRTARERLAL
jgi:hypothetical protein